ncbi:LysR family transcriptional regulator [Paraburkholderia strydomiana]|uniref:LysR family transcriptional regulator n=1 Tax=Paraburkholderia strydomiana TaxID=1245417 RepID=UPI001BE9B56E|nr:LysR family transcriptional regulator [Paraburkholderia strydomiana]MBT2792804.1 LysR family transcriptional regulator [Paraburkholderia strydomiana]
MDLINAMRSFVRVYETGSFSAAAKDLKTGQPSVSKAVGQLEEKLNAKLFLRSTRGLAATDAGRRFYEHATRTLDEADLALRAVHGESATLTGRLRVSGTITFMRQHIIPKLPIFFAEHPRLEIDLLLDDGNVGLIEEGVEVALRMGKLASSGLTARKIGQCRRVVVGTPDYFAQHGSPQQPEDLVDHSTIIFSRGEGGEHLGFSKAGHSRNIVLRPRLRISALEGVRAAVLAGLGIAVVSEWIFTDELDDGLLREALTDWTMPLLDLWAVLPGGRHAGPKSKAFIAFVESQLQTTRYGIR